MRKTDIIRFAGGNFLRRKARSALTVLGVVIGTAAVVIMLSIGIGMNKGFEDQISSYGDLRQIDVRERYSIYNEENDTYESNMNRMPLDDIAVEDFKSIKGVQAVSPESNYYCTIIKDGKQKAQSCSIMGIDAASMKDFGYEILYGRLLDESDIGTNNFVMCFNIPFYFYDMRGGEEIWRHDSKEGEELPFNPVGDFKYQLTWYYGYGTEAVDLTKPMIKLVDANCVGILAQRKGGNDYSQEIYMDVGSVPAIRDLFDKNQNDYYGWGDSVYEEPAMNYYVTGSGLAVSTINPGSASTVESDRKSKYNSVRVLAKDPKYVRDIEEEIAKLGYNTSSKMEWLTQLQDQTKFLRSILGAIGIVAFFVAAISIANTMVMSIYERTREIGIMKVLGCKLSDIRGMFLIEAGIIGITGGIFGVGFSYIASFAVNKLAANGGMDMLGIDASTSSLSVIPLWLDIAALILAIAVGVVSGLYPAIRATRLSALEAIKNE